MPANELQLAPNFVAQRLEESNF
ncbi:hypothetical protein BRAO375_2440009 [Bradyrhizobium sp. ORS 375]|nr:hypothetical protein BRAO375_2440009 [Bradyrhizobium sp. ORS 375]